MGQKFGLRLRQARNGLKLTQAQLGDGRYSAAAISLLESGSREPSAEVLNHLSTKLGIDLGTLKAWDAPTSPAAAEYLVHARNSRTLLAAGQARAAARAACTAANLAAEARDAAGWWQSTMDAALALRDAGKVSAFVAVATTLVEHPLTDESTVLAAQAHTLLSEAHLAEGRAHVAVEDALRAEAAAAPIEDSWPALLHARVALVRALNASGQLDEAWRLGTRMLRAASDHSMTAESSLGLLHWVVGDVALGRGHTEDGLVHHDLASTLLRPQDELRAWAHFCVERAVARLEAGRADEATRACLETARLAHSIVPSAPMERLNAALDASDADRAATHDPAPTTGAVSVLKLSHQDGTED